MKHFVTGLLALVVSLPLVGATVEESELEGLVPAEELENLEDGEFLSFLGLEEKVRPPRRRPPRQRPPRRRPPQQRPRPRTRMYICYAENRYGDVFRYRDRSAYWAQWQAVRNCEARSRGYCEELGCRRIYR